MVKNGLFTKKITYSLQDLLVSSRRTMVSIISRFLGWIFRTCPSLVTIKACSLLPATSIALKRVLLKVNKEVEDDSFSWVEAWVTILPWYKLDVVVMSNTVFWTLTTLLMLPSKLSSTTGTTGTTESVDDITSSVLPYELRPLLLLLFCNVSSSWYYWRYRRVRLARLFNQFAVGREHRWMNREKNFHFLSWQHCFVTARLDLL
jgi:hypothetical protein